jgi:hypothetical protein
MTQVHLIVDDSGSMYFHPDFIRTMRMELDGMADRGESHNLSYTCHIFSDTVVTGKRLGPMPRLASGTIIALGFEAMIKCVNQSFCEHCIIVFVSDGADVRGSEARRAMLPPLKCKSTLLTVAVGDGFPTSLVVDELRVKYHTFGGDSIPLVFPIGRDFEIEIQWVVSQLEEIIQAGGVVQELSMEELGASDVASIFRQCRLWYNACTVRCMAKSTPLQEKILLVDETREKFSRAEELMRAKTGFVKPLPSNLKLRRPIFLLSSLREKLNTLSEQLSQGMLLSNMTDEEKRAYLSHGNVAGRFLATSVKYNAANFGTSKASLRRFVVNYVPTKEDQALMDPINLCSWSEYVEDAQQHIHLIDEMSSMASVVEGMPFLGRVVELHPIPDCAQINPWCNSIKTLPMLVKVVSTRDLFVGYKREMDFSNERGNSLIIFGGDPACPGIFCQFQTYALTTNWLLYFNDSRLAAASMLAVYVLGNCKPGEWKLEELAHVRSICALHTPANSRWWHAYLAVLKTGDFRKCLVTESPKLDKFMTCPGLGKFLLGMWWWADQGHVFTDLSDRFEAVATELIGRCKLDPEPFFVVKRTGLALESTLNFNAAFDAVKPALRASHLSMRKISNLLQTALQVHIKKASLDARANTTVSFKADEVMRVAHFNLSLRQVQCFFHGLSPEIQWAPTKDVLMRAVMVGTAQGSFDRNQPSANATQEAIYSTMAGKMGQKSGETRKEIMSEAKKGVLAYLHLRHLGLPRPIPIEHVLRYKEETGLDIAETWQLDQETGLSPIACCFPACDLYLIIPPGDKFKQRAVIRAHLSTCCQSSIPGLHRCIARNILLPSAEIIPLIESGAELGEPFLPREATKRLERGVGVYGGVPRLFASAEKYKERALELGNKAMPGRIRAAIDEFTGGDPIVLYHAIDDIKISFDPSVWSYPSFKRTFDSKFCQV